MMFHTSTLFVVLLCFISTLIAAPTFPLSFPTNIDGSVLFIRRVRGLAIDGVSQFDQICSNGMFNARALVCDPTTGRNALNAFSYGFTNKPVYAYNAYADFPNAGAYVKIASSPADLLSSGFDTAAAGVANTFHFFTDDNVPLGYTPNYPWPTVELGITMGRSINDQAWSGCSATGSPHPTIPHCNGWSSNAAGTFGAVGTSFLLSPANQRNWLFANAKYDCNAENKWVYCVWSPSAVDGVKNGDETAVDCGGSTTKPDGSQAKCTPCPAGFTGPDGGPCTACPLNTYKPFAGTTACLPCADKIGRTLKTASTKCMCSTGFSAPPATLTSVSADNCIGAHVTGDPQITGIQGQNFQIHGIPDEYFNMITSPNMQVNSHFVYLNSASCPDNRTACFSHPGTYIDEIGIALQHDKIHIVAGSAKIGLTVRVNNNLIHADAHAAKRVNLHTAHTYLEIKDNREISLYTADMIYTVVNSDKFMNQEVLLVNDHIRHKGATPLTWDKGFVLPYPDESLHGILGQTWKNIAYPHNKSIEGRVVDYLVQDSKPLYGTKFKYNLYKH